MTAENSPGELPITSEPQLGEALAYLGERENPHRFAVKLVDDRRRRARRRHQAEGRCRVEAGKA